MAAPRLNGKHGEMITKMYGRIGVLITDVANIKESQKEVKQEISKINGHITDIKVGMKGTAERIKSVNDEIDDHKKEHDKMFGKVLGVIGVITTIVSLAVSVIYNLFKR